MPRIPEVREREALPEEQRAIFDAIAASRGRVAVPFSLLMNSPEVAGRVAHLGAFLRFETSLSPAQRELAMMTAAREADCAFEWAAHVRLGRQEGVREEAITAVGEKHALDGLTEDEALIVGYGRELLRPPHRVSEETFAAARRAFDDRAMVELTMTLGYYSMIACALNAFGVEAPADWPRLPQT